MLNSSPNLQTSIDTVYIDLIVRHHDLAADGFEDERLRIFRLIEEIEKAYPGVDDRVRDQWK